MGDIVAASAKVFREKGFDAARLDDIAQEVGMYKGSIYHYIDSKEDLLFAVVREPSERILGATRKLVEQELPAEEKLRRLCHLHVEVLVNVTPFAAVYIEEIAGKHRFPDWEAKDREYMRLVEDIMRELLGDRRDVDPPVAARALVGALNWMTRWYRSDGRMDADQIADQVADVFLGGLRG
jgi:AcrR family transcriptional regulator